ncbi:MAG: hypothetical protein A2Y76_16010 [Planctomycetes bacterium RBG_13_60_9]|nr:MAG: hypothetical protein A2Y76_16010 [Planctomycetes bacterium RBG_13_60_9]
MVLRSGAATLAGASVSPLLAAEHDPSDHLAPVLPRPTAAQLAWQDCEVGVIFHFDLPVAAGDTTGNNAVRRTFDPDLYQPRQLDTDQWLEAAKACGARYAAFTATHFNGFMQWQSDLYPYGLKQTSWRHGRGDVVADFVASCRRAGIKPGIYLSVHRNVYHEVWGHYVDWGKGRGTPAQERFNRIAEGQMAELCSRYGPLVQIWFDAGTKTPAEGGPDMVPIFEKYQPDSVFYHSSQRADHRWIGNEQGYAGDPCWATMPGGPRSHNAQAWKKVLGTGDPDGPVWSPGMVDVPLRGVRPVHSWFWAPGQDHAAHPTETLVEMYHQSVGRNCNFIIGAVVTPEGFVPQSDIARLAEFGRDIRRLFGTPVARIAGEGRRIELPLPRPCRIECVSLMEEIAHGEQIRRFALRGLAPSGEWVKLGEGQSVGHKRLVKITPREVTKVRLEIEEARALPRIRELAVHTGSEKGESAVSANG